MITRVFCRVECGVASAQELLANIHLGEVTPSTAVNAPHPHRPRFRALSKCFFLHRKLISHRLSGGCSFSLSSFCCAQWARVAHPNMGVFCTAAAMQTHDEKTTRRRDMHHRVSCAPREVCWASPAACAKRTSGARKKTLSA